MSPRIAPQVKKLLEAGFAPWGIVIPNPQNAPKGSGVFQFRRALKRGFDEASIVIAPSHKVIRGIVSFNKRIPITIEGRVFKANPKYPFDLKAGLAIIAKEGAA